MYCKNCGKEIREGAVFCAECGTKVGEKASSTHRTSKKSRKNKIILIAIVIVAVIAVLGIIGGSDEEEKNNETVVTTQAVETETSTEPEAPEYKYVGDVFAYMTSDVMNENIEIDGIAVFVSMGMDGTPGNTIQVVLRDEEWNSTISLNGINDDYIENCGLEDGDYCSVKGYVYYDEYGEPAMDVDSIQVW